MRIGFAITGIGAACAFGAMVGHATITRHQSDNSALLANESRSASFYVLTQHLADYPLAGEEAAIELADQASGGSLGSLLKPPTSPFDDGPVDPIPLKSLQMAFSGFDGPIGGGGGGGVGGAGGLGANGGEPSSALPPPVDPPKDSNPPSPPNLGGLGGVTGGGGGAPLPPDPPDSGPFTPPPPPPPPPPTITPPPSPPPPPPPKAPVTLLSFAAPAAPPSPAPEPATWVAMLAGFVLLGGVLRRLRIAPA